MRLSSLTPNGNAFLAAFVLVVLPAAGTFAAPARPPAQPANANVVIVYDGPDLPLADGYLGAHFIKNLLGHFGLRGELIRLADYKAGDLAHYRTAFYIGTLRKTRLPAPFLKDVRSSTSQFCWLGQHIDMLLAGPGAEHQFGFRSLGTQANPTGWRVEYKDTLFPEDTFNLNIVELLPGGGAEVRAEVVQRDNTRRPYALKRGRFWYLAEPPAGSAHEGSRYLVFCDLLHDILEIDHAPQSLALARIEDVSAEAEPGDLRAVADVLSKRAVPFQIATIPLYRDPWNNVEMRLSDRPKVVDAIHYMVARGGTPVMHGWSHQYHGSTGDDYEFWDALRDSAIGGDSEREVSRRIESGVAELFSTNVFPVAFETPHYAASAVDYRAMRSYFTLFYERVMPTPNMASVQYFPYPVVDEFGRYVVPENLGYLPREKPDPKAVIAAARYMRVVRDGLPSFYFHPFLSAALLDQVVGGIQELGYRFVSLREFGGELNDGERQVVRTESGSVRLSPRSEFWRLRRFDAAGKLLTERTSTTAVAAPIKVEVEVPSGGWAALDCMERVGTPGRLARTMESLKAWWKGTNRKASLKETTSYGEPGEAWILWLATPSPAEANNQESYRTVLQTFGFSSRPVAVREFKRAPTDNKTLVVIPEGAARQLSRAQESEVLNYLSGGGAVVTDGRQEWITALGFRPSGWHLPVTEVQENLIEDASFSWEPEELVERYTPPPDSRTLAFETDIKQPVAIAGQHGRGHYLYLAAPLDTHTRYGLSRYPYLAQYLADTFHLSTALRGGRLEAYFDPDYRAGVNPDNLAAYWKEVGVRAVYVAAWKIYDSYTFHYSSLIRACHRNGISVYAWFMFPQTTPLMWQQHPEWREQAIGGDGQPGWRYPMNFQNPVAFRAAMDWAKQVLRSQEWDGINIAELNFDAEHPEYLRPDHFVPMNAEVRRDFRKQGGFDPVELFAPASPYWHQRNPAALEKFLRYRVEIVTEWHRRVLTELLPLAREGGLDVIVTVMDSLHSQYVQPALGVDSRQIVALMKEFDFTLQLEDPVEHWREAPDRYRRFAEAYRKLVPDERRLMFDINVVDRNTKGTSLPSTVARGTELAETVAAAAMRGRVAIYAEHTVEPQDWPLLETALAESAHLVKRPDGYEVQSPFPVFLADAKSQAYLVDSKAWPVISSGRLAIPSGEHRVSAAPGLSFLGPALRPAAWCLSCDLLQAQEHSAGLTLHYANPARAAIVLNQRPLAISVDGQPSNIPVEALGDKWVIRAPRGEHNLEVTTLNQSGLVLGWWSWTLTFIIASSGGTAIVLMLCFYVRLLLRPEKVWRRPAE